MPIIYNDLQLPQLLEFQLITRLSEAGVNCPDRQLQHRVRGQTSGQSSWNHLPADLAYPLFPIQIHDIDRELHAEAMHRLTGHDPQSCARLQAAMLQEARPPFRARVGHFRSFGHSRAAVTIPYPNLQDLGYNTISPQVLRNGDFFRERGF